MGEIQPTQLTVEAVATASSVRFGPFDFDTESLELRRDGEAVDLQPQAARVLAFLISRPGRLVSRDQLRDFVWEGRAVEFDAGLNFSIHKVRQALEDNAESPRFIETVPRRGYRFVGHIEPVASAPAARARTRLRVLGALGAALVAAVAVAGVTAVRTAPDAATERVTLAVVPFARIEAGRELDVFARGLDEDLLTTLATLSPPRLAVIAPSSIRRLDAANMDSVALGEALNVDFVVRGTVREPAAEHRVTVRLEDASTGEVVWARRFDENTESDLALQTSIAQGVAAALSLEVLGTIRGARRDDLSAASRQAMLEARWMLGQRSREDTERALSHLAAVRAEAPEHTQAWELTAHAHGMLGDHAAAERAAREALRLEPDSAEANYQLAQALVGNWRFEDAALAYRHATQAAPGIARYRQGYAQLLSNLRRFGEAINQIELSRALDPISTFLDSDMAMIYTASGRPDDAVPYCRRSLALVPEGVWGHYCLFAAHHFAGDDARAQAEAIEIMSILDASDEALATVASAAPEAAATEYFAWRADQAREAASNAPSYALAQALGGLRQREATLEAMRRVADAHTFEVMWFAKEPYFAFLHGDPEYVAILRRVGLPAPEAS